MRQYAKLFGLVFTALTFAGCWSGPVKIPDGASAEEIVQLAQNAMDRDRYKQAIQYYQAVMDRFPYNNEAMCGAEYSIAFIHYKQKKYDLAKEEFRVFLARFDAPGGNTLPKKYQVLSRIVLERIIDKEKIIAEE